MFCGIIKTINTTKYDNDYYLEIEAITFSGMLDTEVKSRSFQNIEMTYEGLVKEVITDYVPYDFVFSSKNNVKIGKPIFQYKETDWEFLKRIASEIGETIIINSSNEKFLFSFGKEYAKSYSIEDDTYYKAGKDLKSFYKAGGYEAGFHDTDYFYYEINRKEKYNIGDKITFKNKELYVERYKGIIENEEIIYKYRLCRKNGIWVTKKYNDMIAGASLEGEVLAVDGENVKVKLDIDKKQEEKGNAWFKYSPPTGNVMYSMPLVGTKVDLYFPDETMNDPIITNCIRSNGGSCEKTSDSSKRYFGTEHGSELEMTPNAINIKGGCKENLSISFDDNVGVILSSPKKLTLKADEEIIFNTPKEVKIKGTSQVLVLKPESSSGISVENEFHILGENVVQDGQLRETYEKFDDEPKKADPPEEESFQWGKLFTNVLAGLAVVAVATVAIGLVIGTGGVGLAMMAGAALSGTIAVGTMAASDIISGKVSSMSDYVLGAAREAFIGAISGAVFGPVGALETLTGKMLFGGATGVFESVLRQLIQDRKIDIGTLIFDGMIGAATGGIFHGLGKASKGLGSKFSKAFPGISDELSNCFRALSGKAKDDLIALGRYIDDIVNSLNPKGVAVDAYGGKYSLPNDKSTFEDFINYIVGHGDDSVGKVSETSYVKSIADLKNTKNFTKNALKHILEGEINKRGKAVGFHYEGFPTAKGKIIEGTKSVPDELGIYTGRVEISGIAKTANGGKSTFFPESWTAQDIVDGINEAYNNRIFKSGNEFYGYTSKGLKIRMYIDVNSDKIISAFPDFSVGGLR